MTVITLPWPPRQLSPNARVHWAKRASATKAYRSDCALIAMSMGARQLRWPAAHLDIEFQPPSRRHHDADNCLASFKAGIDGIADATAINDRNFTTSHRLGEPVKGGAVVVTIREGQP